MKTLRWLWVAIIVAGILYLGAELLWYLRFDFASLHEWSTSPTGCEVRGDLLLAVIGFALVTLAVVARHGKRPKA